MTRGFAFAAVGLAAGFSGATMLAFILTGAPLLAAEAVTIGASFAVLAIVLARSPRAVVREIARVGRAGITAGAVATIVYDLTRTALSIADPSPYNPFEAIRQFGVGVMPPGSDPAAVLAAGFVVHLVNGSSFGVIYAMFAYRQLSTRRIALISGMGWGFVLEFIQSILYPGWLGITTVLGEFLVISGLGHLAYGATLGLGVRWLIRRGGAAEREGEGVP